MFVCVEMRQRLLGAPDSAILSQLCLFEVNLHRRGSLFAEVASAVCNVMQNIMGTELGGRRGNAPSKNQLRVDLDPTEGVEPGIVIYGSRWLLARRSVIMSTEKQNR